MIPARRQRIALPLAQAKAPPALVITRHIGDPIRMLRYRVKKWIKLLSIHPHIDRLRIPDYMEIVLCEIDESNALLVIDIGFGNIPLVRNGPVERNGAGGNLPHLQSRHDRLHISKGGADTISRKTPT